MPIVSFCTPWKQKISLHVIFMSLLTTLNRYLFSGVEAELSSFGWIVFDIADVTEAIPEAQKVKEKTGKSSSECKKNLTGR